MDPFPRALELTQAELTAMRGYCQRIWPLDAGAPWPAGQQPTSADVVSALSYSFSAWVADNALGKDAAKGDAAVYMHHKAMFSVMVGRVMQQRNDDLMRQVSELTKANAALEARVKMGLTTYPGTPPRKKMRVEPVPPSLVPTPSKP